MTRLPTMISTRQSWPLLLTILMLASAGARAQAVFVTPQPVGTSSTQSVIVTPQAAGSVTVAVLTAGAQGEDFAAVPSSSNCLSVPLEPGQNCTETVTFTPAYPGLRVGAVVLLDVNGNILGTTYLSGIGSGGLGVLSPGNLELVAGVYRNWTSTKDGIPATQANLWLPSGLTMDGAGNLYIADSNHNRIRMVCASATSATILSTAAACTGPGIITTVAGTGEAGYTGDKQAASAATLSNPSGVALDGAGNLYIADSGNNVIRMVSPAGIITTVAGNGTAGYEGDGLLATSPQVELNQPQGVTVDAGGNLYIADTYNQRIRRVDVITGDIATAAGDGDPSGKGDNKGTYTGDAGVAVNAGLSLPFAVAFDTSGNMYIPDSANNVIRMVAAINGGITPASTISTVVGFYPGTAGSSGDNGPAIKALLNTPSGVAVDAAGNIYVADTQNARIQKVNASTGKIATMAVSTPASAPGPVGAPPPVEIYAPVGLFLDGSGNLYFADYYYMLIEGIASNKAVLNFTATAVYAGSESKPQTETVENDGNAVLDLTQITPGLNTAVDPGTITTCLPTLTTPFPLDVDADCQIGVIFAPALTAAFPKGATSEVLAGDVDVDGNTANYPLNTLNFPLDIEAVGVAVPVNATNLTLISSANPSDFGQNVAFTAIVTSGAGQGTPTGTATFSDTFLGVTTQLGSPVTLNGAGGAIYATTTLAVGAHTITATYTPSTGAKYLPSTPMMLTQTVGEVTATTLSSSANPSVLGAMVTLTATVTVTGGGGVPLDGTVTFTDTTTGTVLGNPAVGTTGIVTVSTSALAYGIHAIAASYSGDATSGILTSTSAVLKQDVQTPSTTTLNSSPNPSIYGDAVIFTVTVPTIGTVAATGTVNILEAGQAAPIGTATLSGNPGTGTFTTSSLTVGTDSITAAYLGDLDYGPSNSLPINQVVNLTQTITTVAAVPNPGTAGKPVAITATVTLEAGAPMTGGSVTFTDGTISLGTVNLNGEGVATIDPMLAVGQHSIVATYSGDINGAGSASAALQLTVAQATTQTTVTATPNPAVVQAAVTFTAQVTGNGGALTGSVTFNANGTAIGTPATLDATGTATITYSGLAAGSYTITAVYSGDTNDQGSTGTGAAQLVVGVIPTVTNLGLSATTGPTPQVILVAVVLNNATGSPASLSTPTGTVTFNSMSGTTATAIGSSQLDSSGVATLEPNLPPGSYQIEAVYGGDASHGPSTSNVVTASNTGTGFNLSVTPASVSMATKQSATVNVAVSSITGFVDTIGLGCASLPAGVNCHFSAPSVALQANGVSNVSLTIDTNNPLGGGSSAMNARRGGQGISLAGFGLPLSLPLSFLLGCVIWRFRRRYAWAITAVLILLLGIGIQLVTGCSSFSQSSATPGTYVIQVTGTGTTSDITHYQNVTLTITAK